MKTIAVAALGTTILTALALAPPAAAADLRPITKAAPVPMAPAYLPYNWTGFYIGANIGAGWANADLTTSTGFTRSAHSDARFIGGGQIGYNWQFDPHWLIGVEATGDGIASNDRTIDGVVINGVTFNGSAHATWTATAAGRLGYVADNWLFYGKGGGGWVGFDTSATCVSGAVCAGTTINGSSSRGGWMAGAGIEWGFAPNWSAKAEYQFIGLSDRDIGTLNGVTFSIHDPNIQTFTVGVNYLFR